MQQPTYQQAMSEALLLLLISRCEKRGSKSKVIASQAKKSKTPKQRGNFKSRVPALSSPWQCYISALS